MNRRRSWKRSLWVPTAIVWLATGIRLFNLDYHSIWFDEAMSVHWARSDIGRILEVSMNLVEDRLPPLYYLLLHGWRLLAGDGEIGVRLPSVFLGVLLVAVVYRLGRYLFGRQVAALAAALAAINPFLVWYSQEARMYALAVLLATSGTWFFVRATDAWIIDPSPSKQTGRVKGVLRRPLKDVLWWMGYGGCVLAGLYTHLYTAFLVPGQAIYLLLTHRRSRRVWMSFIVTMLLVICAFLPLAISLLRVSGEAGPGNPWNGLGGRLWHLLTAFTVWEAPLSSWWGRIIAGLMLALAGIGLLVKSDPPFTPKYNTAEREAQNNPTDLGYTWHKPRLLIGLLLFCPLMIASLMMFRNQLAFFGERYFIVMVPWLLMAIAAGAFHLAGLLDGQATGGANTTRWGRTLVAAACCALPLTLTLIPLPGQWSPEARKEAWRESVAYLAGHARPEDAVLIHPDWTRYPLQYYFRGPGQTYATFSSVNPDTDLDGPLEVISGRHPVVWLVESHIELADPDRRVNAWLAARYPEVTELYPPGLAGIHAYAPGYQSVSLPDFARPVHVRFQNGLQLAGFDVPDTHVMARGDIFHPPSSWVHVTLFWNGELIGQDEPIAFVHLVDDWGRVWGVSLERSNDAFDFYPPTRWQRGQVVRLDLDVNINPVIPPGEYSLVAGLRDAQGGQIALDDGQPQVVLTSVVIE